MEHREKPIVLCFRTLLSELGDMSVTEAEIIGRARTAGFTVQIRLVRHERYSMCITAPYPTISVPGFAVLRTAPPRTGGTYAPLV